MSVKRRPNGRWRVRYRDADRKEHAKDFARKTDADAWEAQQVATVNSGTHVDPAFGRLTLGEWCDTWLEGYGVNRASSLKQAKTHVKRIKASLGDRRLHTLRPSDVRNWVSSMQAEGLADSTVNALHARLRHILDDAVLDGCIGKSPVSKRTAPKAGEGRTYVATTEQIWALHDAIEDSYRPVVLLGAFAGLRLGELMGLREGDIDFMGATITPAVQDTGPKLKTRKSGDTVPVARYLVNDLASYAKGDSSRRIVRNAYDREVSRSSVQIAFREARAKVKGLRAGFRIHDLRHYYASLLISEGLDVKTVQACLRHGSAKTTLDTYGHLWPDKDESARVAIDGVFAARADSLRTFRQNAQ